MSDAYEKILSKGSGYKPTPFGYTQTPLGYTQTPPPTYFVIADIPSHIVIIIIMTCLNKYFIIHIIAKSGTLLLIAALNSSGLPGVGHPGRSIPNGS